MLVRRKVWHACQCVVEGSAWRCSTYRQLWVLDCKLLELGQELLTALWRKDRVENGHGFGSHGVGEAFDGAHDARHGGQS
jgi:hypothetical protein